MTSKVGFLILAVLLLPSASGIHTALCHVPHHIQIQKINGSSVNTMPETCDPETGPCNACFFTQILTQCMISAIGTIVVPESILFNKVYSQKAVIGRALEHAVNRGPPTGIIFS
jgi:hypothetical protein